MTSKCVKNVSDGHVNGDRNVSICHDKSKCPEMSVFRTRLTEMSIFVMTSLEM